jgi:hypothetical protein
MPSGSWSARGWSPITSRVGVRPPPYPFKAEDICRMKEAVEPLMARWAAERPSAVQRAEYSSQI